MAAVVGVAAAPLGAAPGAAVPVDGEPAVDVPGLNVDPLVELDDDDVLPGAGRWTPPVPSCTPPAPSWNGLAATSPDVACTPPRLTWKAPAPVIEPTTMSKIVIGVELLQSALSSASKSDSRTGWMPWNSPPATWSRWALGITEMPIGSTNITPASTWAAGGSMRKPSGRRPSLICLSVAFGSCVGIGAPSGPVALPMVKVPDGWPPSVERQVASQWRPLSPTPPGNVMPLMSVVAFASRVTPSSRMPE